MFNLIKETKNTEENTNPIVMYDCTSLYEHLHVHSRWWQCLARNHLHTTCTTTDHSAFLHYDNLMGSPIEAGNSLTRNT